ncbi:MAG: nitrile hydratase accessory protein [Candidatus Rokubacteria bacterium]|nr:nitrile hydratase accessory protein [Candidatus Rokubacteria bacterium]
MRGARVDLGALPAIPRDAEGPVFRAPWEAQAFAMAVKLHEAGHFTWREWADRLATEIAAAGERGEHDDGARYYHYWLAALEKLVADKGLLGPGELERRAEAWAEAAKRTPHGQPIVLNR